MYANLIALSAAFQMPFEKKGDIGGMAMNVGKNSVMQKGDRGVVDYVAPVPEKMPGAYCEKK